MVSATGIMRAVSEPMMLQALPGTVERDGWDWLLYVLSASAAVTAIGAFLTSALEQRRRPEIRFYWRLSLDGDPAHLADWEPNEVPEIKAAQPFLVAAAFQNTGDKAGRDTLINFVASDCFDLRQWETPENEPLH